MPSLRCTATYIYPVTPGANLESVVPVVSVAESSDTPEYVSLASAKAVVEKRTTTSIYDACPLFATATVRYLLFGFCVSFTVFLNEKQKTTYVSVSLRAMADGLIAAPVDDDVP